MDAIKNFAGGMVSTGYNASATSIVLTSGYIARFPAPPFNAVWWNYTDYPEAWNDPNVEIVRVTAIAGDTMTVARAQEATAPSAKNTTDKVYRIMAPFTKGLMDQILSELALKAPLASPALTGIPTAPTAPAATNTLQLATTAFVRTEIAGVTGGDPAMVGDITGTASANAIAVGVIVNADVNASAGIAQSKVASLVTDLAAKAPLVSPALTGVPTAPTAAPGTSTLQIATTAFVGSAVGGGGGTSTPAGTISVKDAPYNATGNGVTDDTDAIQAAIDAAFGPPSAPHAQLDAELNKELYFPPGDYIITRPLLLTKVHGAIIRGAGRFTTKITNTNSGSVFITNGWQYSVMQGLAMQASFSLAGVTNEIHRWFGQKGPWLNYAMTTTTAYAASPLDSRIDAVLITDTTGSPINPQISYEHPAVSVDAFNSNPATAGLGVTNNFTYSAYLKKAGSNFAFLAFGATSHWVSAVFNLDAGTTTQTSTGGSGTLSTTTITAVAGQPGWYRCSVSGNVPDGIYFCAVGTVPVASGNTFIAFGTPQYNGTSSLSVIVGKEVQIESGLTLTPYNYQPCCLDIDNDGQGLASLQSNSINDCFFDGGNFGVRIGVSTFQGSEMVFNNCFFMRGLKAGLITCNFNACQIQVFGGNFQSNGIAIRSWRGSIPIIHGVGFQLSDYWDLRVDATAHDSYSVAGCRTESKNFILTYSFPTLHISACTQASAFGPTPGVFVEAHGPVCITSSQSDYGAITGNNTVILQGCMMGLPALWQSTAGLPFSSYVAIASGTPLLLTNTQMASGRDRVINLTATLGGVGTVTTPTAAQIISGINAWTLDYFDGWSYRLRIINSSSADFAWTLAAGTNVTLLGTMSIAQNAWRDFIVTIGGSLTTISIQSVGVGGASTGGGGDPTMGGDLSGTASSAQIVAGAIVNADVNASAAIAYAKLNLAGSVTNADLSGSIDQSKVTNLTSDLALKAPLASPSFTGNPLAPTAAANDNDTSIANTQYVQAEFTAYASDSVAFTNKSVNGLTITTSTGTLTVANGKTLTASNTLILAGTDGTTMTFPSVSSEIGFRGIPQNSQSANYTTVLTDSAKHILHPAADNNARTFTIAANASVAYPIGSTLTFVNEINTLLIAINSDSAVQDNTGSTGTRTLAPNNKCTYLKITATKWTCSGTIGFT